MAGITYTVLIDHTPASPDMLEAIQEIQVENNSDMASVLRLRLAIGLSEQGDWTIVEENPFEPLTPIAIRVQIGTALSEPLISGYVVSQRVSMGNEPGQSFLEVVGMDATVLMNLEEKIAAWPNMADSDIATAIFSQSGLTPEVEPTQPVRQETELTIIQRGTDSRFLRQLADRNGCECYVETDPMLNVDVGHFHPPKLQGKTQGVLSVSFGEQTNVTSFKARYEMLQPTTAQASALDIRSKSVQNAQTPAVSEHLLGQAGLLERMSSQPVVLPGRTGLPSTGELQTLCQAIVNRSSWAIIAEGELNTAVYEGILRAHRTVNVRGAGQLYSGAYYVSRVLHTFSGEGYTQRFELRRNAIGLVGNEAFVDTGA